MAWLLRNVFDTSFRSALRKQHTRVFARPIALCFLFLALATCATQSTLLGLTLNVSMQGRRLVSDIIDAAGVQRGFTVVHGDVIEICHGIPSLRGTSCDVVYNGTASDSQATTDTAGLASRDVSATPLVDGAGTIQGVAVTNLGSSSSPTTLSLQCVESLTWLETFLRDAKSEEVVQIIFQCWLFSNSLIALVIESTPHLVVVLASHGANTAWSIFRHFTERAAEQTYNGIVSGACDGVDVLGGWPSDVFRYAILGIQSGVFLCMIFLVYQLVKVYGKEMFSSVGSSLAVTRVLKLLHWLTVFLQFASFHIVASAAAWFDKRKTGIVSPYSHSTLQDVTFIVVSAIVLPWSFLVRTTTPDPCPLVSSPLSSAGFTLNPARTERLVLDLLPSQHRLARILCSLVHQRIVPL
ncbi:hypothetical protein EDC04DRAFT_2230244 [Pisolithus marmoratus]|nr:hypothetical protein EDC04DRAFT_2230244 [Pisolithus marmoratus]